MSDRYFLDTNVFVYSFDHTAPKKQLVAHKLIADSLSTALGCISSQVVQEFMNVALNKFKPAMDASQIELYLEAALMPLCSIFPSKELYKRALDVRDNTKFSFYDALIVAAAQEAGCRTLYSEDLQDERRVGALVIRNPFVT